MAHAKDKKELKRGLSNSAETLVKLDVVDESAVELNTSPTKLPEPNAPITNTKVLVCNAEHIPRS